MNLESLKPTKAFRTVSFAIMALSALFFSIGLFNAELALSEKGFYVSTFVFGLYSVVTFQKTLRDKLEGIKVNNLYFNLSVIGLITPILLTGIGLFNAELPLNEKGFFAVTFIMSLFSAIVVQKNTRDIEAINIMIKKNKTEEDKATGKNLKINEVLKNESKK